MLAQHFRQISVDPPNANGNVLAGLAKSFGVDPSSPLFFTLMSEVRGRIDALQAFAENVVDKELDETLRSEVRAATSAFANLFRPEFLVNRWEDTCARMLTDANLKTLLWFGQTARRHRPLRLINNEERAEMASKLQDALADLEADAHLDWMKAPLIDGIKRLITTIEYLRFFGHDYAIEQLLDLNLFVSALQQTQEAHSKTGLSAEQSSLWKCVAAFSVVANLLLLPDQGATAISRYQGWVASIIASTPRLPHEQRLLAPPSAVVPKEPEEAPRA